MPVAPSRGEVWRANLDPPTGHEQAGWRPVVVISTDAFNHGPARMVAVVPVTSRDKGIPLHVRLDPPEGGLTMASFAMCDQIRTISTERLDNRGALGALNPRSVREIEEGIKVFLDLF